MADIAFTVSGAFERAVIYWLLSSDLFASRFINELDEELFTSEQGKFIAKLLVQYFKSKQRYLTDFALLDNAMWQLHTSGKLTAAAMQSAQHYVANLLCEQHPAEESVFKDFAEVVRARIHHQAAIRAVDLASNMAPLSEIVETIQRADAMLAANHTEHFMGSVTSSIRDWAAVIKESATKLKLPTLVADVDATLDGGLVRQTMGMIAGPTGGGKSKLLRQFACAAMAQGHNVAYVVLEDSPKTVFADILAMFSGLPVKAVLANPDAAEPYVIDRCRRLGTAPGQLLMEAFRSGITLGQCIAELHAKIKRASFKPDLLVVDYIDKFTGVSKPVDNEYTCGRDVVDALRNYAVDHDYYVWTACQTRRQSNAGNYKSLDENDVAGSMHKARTTDVLLSLHIRQAEIGGQEVRVWFSKNRNGSAGVGTQWAMPMYRWGHVLATSAFSPQDPRVLPPEIARYCV